MDAQLSSQFMLSWASVLRKSPLAFTLYAWSLARATRKGANGEYLYYETGKKQLHLLGYPVEPEEFESSRRALSRLHERLLSAGAWTVYRKPAPGRMTVYAVRLTPFGRDDITEIPKAENRANGSHEGARELAEAWEVGIIDDPWGRLA